MPVRHNHHYFIRRGRFISQSWSGFDNTHAVDWIVCALYCHLSLIDIIHRCRHNTVIGITVWN